MSVLRFKKNLCKDCGKPIPADSADGLCATCRVKQRTKQRQALAAERAKARARRAGSRTRRPKGRPGDRRNSSGRRCRAPAAPAAAPGNPPLNRLWQTCVKY